MYIRGPMNGPQVSVAPRTAVVVSAAIAVALLSVFAVSIVGGQPAAKPPGTPLAASPDPASAVLTVVASVDVGTEPMAGAVDLATGLVYIANAVSNNVSVLSGTSVVATISLAPNQTGTPVYVTYDGVNGYVYVVDRYDFESKGGAVTVVDGTSVLATIPVGPLPNFAVVDPSHGYLYVTDSGGAVVTVIDGTSVLASVPVGAHPSAAAYDPLDGYVYVANEGSANVSVLFNTTVVDALPSGTGPDSVAYDPADGWVYVANNVSGNVTIYNDLAFAGSLPAGADPSFVASNPSVGGVEVANTNSSNLTVITGGLVVATLAVDAGPVWLGLDPTGVYTLVADSFSNEVTVLNGTSSVGNVPVGSVPVYGVADPVHQLTYVLNSGSNNVSVFAFAYPVAFNETGLAPGVAWSVTLGTSVRSSTSSSIGFFEPPGTFAYAIATPTGYRLVSAVPPSPLSVTTAGAVVNVTFALLPTSTYNLTFTETGLGGGGCQGHGGDNDPQASPAWGRSSSLSWGVTVDNVTKTTTNTSLTFTEANGVHNYTVHAPSNYTVTSSVPASPVTIAGANLTVNVTFARSGPSHPLSITFRESGLRWGTVWCVTLNGTACSSDPEIVFSGLSPGNYTFNVAAVRGYTAHPDRGEVLLSTHSETVYVRFSEDHHHGGGCGG